MLSRISPVFEGLFSILAVDETEKHEGTPVMYMMDRADALQRLLQLVYHDVYVCPRRVCRMAVLTFVPKKFTT